tara:strand:+ start:1342 stop:1683 length:342 start_codon:yes stop_codon:yes gene_type:complete
MRVEFVGTVTQVGEVNTFGNDFKVLEIIAEEEGNSKWPNPLPFRFIKDDANVAYSRIGTGDKIKIDGEAKGRFNGDQTRCFINIEVRNFEVLSSTPAAAAAADPVPVPQDIPF